MDVDFIMGTRHAFEMSINAIFKHKDLLVGEVSDTKINTEKDNKTGDEDIT